MDLQKLQEAKEFLEKADAVLITAGAGMGVDSGLPDFRGNDGFWEAYPAIKEKKLSFSRMANPSWFEKDPHLAWAFYGHRLNLYRKTVPHKGFSLLLDLVHKKNDNYFIFTSNVDGQFQKAGFDQEKTYEVHGSIHHFQCTKGCSQDVWDAKGETVRVDMENFRAKNLPKCKHCNALARPNILMFWDTKWLAKRADKQESRFMKWIRELQKKQSCVAIIEIGAGSAIPTVRQRGEHLARTLPDAKLFRINPREFELDDSLGFSMPYGGLEGIEMLQKSTKK